MSTNQASRRSRAKTKSVFREYWRPQPNVESVTELGSGIREKRNVLRLALAFVNRVLTVELVQEVGPGERPKLRHEFQQPAYRESRGPGGYIL